MKSALLAITMAAFGSGAAALTAEEERDERERIRLERVAVDAVYVARERECRTRFAVTSCLDDAKRERRQALDRLRRQEALLDETRRKERAAKRMEEIRAKTAQSDAQRRKPPSR